MGDFWRVVYCVQCWSARLRQKEKEKEAQRIQMEIFMSLQSSSVMADGKFKKEVNKITEVVKVHRTDKPEQLDWEHPLTRSCDVEVQSDKREYFFPHRPR